MMHYMRSSRSLKIKKTQAVVFTIWCGVIARRIIPEILEHYVPEQGDDGLSPFTRYRVVCNRCSMQVNAICQRIEREQAASTG